MLTLAQHLRTSIVKKQVLATTGLLLCGFLLSHLVGNLLIFVGSDAFNKYSHALISNPLIYVAEAILAGIFLTHLALAIKITLENKAARPEPYYLRVASGRGATFASSTMPYTGIIILAYLIWHICGIKFGTHYDTTVGGVVMRDLYKLMMEYFQSELNVALYVLAQIAVGIHVSHGFWSAFQSFGFNHPKYNGPLRLISKIYGFGVALGFAALPVYCYLVGGN